MKGTFFYKDILESLLDIVGNTPVVRINKLVKDDWAEIFCKIEFFNPCGSVKDRICLSMIEAAEREGKLKKGDTIIEPTSGNTGIAYAMIAAVKEYRTKIVLPRNASIERKKIITGFGAEIVYSSEFEGSDGALRTAEKIKEGMIVIIFPDGGDRYLSHEI